MRIQMRLSKEARIILEEEKIDFLRMKEITATYGFITNSIFISLSDDIKNDTINWKFVKDISEFNDILTEYRNLNPTTLNLSDNTVGLMEMVKNSLNILLKMDRTVYRSFIIRIVLKAYKLKKEGYDIYLKS